MRKVCNAYDTRHVLNRANYCGVKHVLMYFITRVGPWQRYQSALCSHLNQYHMRLHLPAAKPSQYSCTANHWQTAVELSGMCFILMQQQDQLLAAFGMSSSVSSGGGGLMNVLSIQSNGCTHTTTQS